MNQCASYQALMLEYLYDLPEEGDRRALRQHLDECGACPEALRRTEREKRLLETAARVPWPQVRFDARALEDTARRVRVFPPVLKDHSGRWRTWSVAACLLIALTVLCVRDAYRGLNREPEGPGGNAQASPSTSGTGSLAAAATEKPDEKSGPASGRTMRPSVHVVKPRGSSMVWVATVQSVDVPAQAVQILLTEKPDVEDRPAPAGSRVELERLEPPLKLSLIVSGSRSEGSSFILILAGEPSGLNGLRVGDRVRVLPLTAGK